MMADTLTPSAYMNEVIPSIHRPNSAKLTATCGLLIVRKVSTYIQAYTYSSRSKLVLLVRQVSLYVSPSLAQYIDVLAVSGHQTSRGR